MSVLITGRGTDSDAARQLCAAGGSRRRNTLIQALNDRAVHDELAIAEFRAIRAREDAVLDIGEDLKLLPKLTAESSGEELRLCARKAGSFHQYFLGTHNLIMGLVKRGFLGEALRLAREGAAMAAANHHRLEQFWLESLQTLVALEAFDYEGALPACERIAGEPIMMRHNLTPHVLLWLGRASLGRGQVERAAETFRRLATAIDSGGVGFEYHIPLLQEQASCALAADDDETWRSLTNRSIQLAREHRQPGYLARGYQLLSDVATRAGDYPAAAEHLSVAIRALAETDIPNVEWQVHATAATIFAKAGRLQESEQSRTRAIEVGQRVAAALSNEPPLRTSLLGQITKLLLPVGSGSPPTLACVTSGSP